jgi:hypothetical protein
MSLADSFEGFETFFEPTRIWLFGKRFTSLTYNAQSMGANKGQKGEFSRDFLTPGAGKPLPMPPKRIERTLRRGIALDANGDVVMPDGSAIDQDSDPIQFFARIYSFTYEAHYYRLPRPLLFLVNAPGEPIGGGQPEPGEEQTMAADRDAALQKPAGKELPEEKSKRQELIRERQRRNEMRARFTAKFTGVEARDWNFSNDIRVWAVDRKDLTVCLDVEIGNYQEILLDSMIASDRREEDRASRSRGDLIGRGAGSFRGDMIGPHQNK